MTHYMSESFSCSFAKSASLALASETERNGVHSHVKDIILLFFLERGLQMQGLSLLEKFHGNRFSLLVPAS